MSKRIDLVGRRFGRLIVTAYAQDRKWFCFCDCGVRVLVSLRGGRKSCGCLRKAGAITHRMSGSREYNSWHSMKQRCFNPRHRHYKHYGGRGITVCEDWLSFEAFFADMGPRPAGCSLDRIDPNGNYEPTNCRWSDAKQQFQNQRPRQASAAVKRRRLEQTERLLPLLEDPPF